MNELNLQNPEFLKRISQIFYTSNGLIVKFTVFGKYLNFVEQLKSPNKPLEKHQQWFYRIIRQEIKTLKEFDELRIQREKVI
jgi:hypothetical protein